MKIKIDENVREILDILLSYGKSYIVGGYVRDKILGLNPSDADFVTEISYPDLLKIFQDYKPKEVGKHFGIIMIKYKGKYYEIAKLREDKGVPKTRKLQEINFVSDIYLDLKRRDFTINAIAYDGINFYYDDISYSDLQNKFLRFIGDTKKRIQEDPLRILRAFRFLGTKDLNSCIDMKIIEENRFLIKNLSSDRIREEFHKIIMSPNLKVLKIMEEAKILDVILPNIKINDEIIANLEKIENLKDRLKYLYIASDYDMENIKYFNYSKKFCKIIKNGKL